MNRVTKAAYVSAAMVLWGAVSTIAAEPGDQYKPLIQIAILLDTSGSMSGLINQARSQLWKVVNEFATAKQDGRVPELQVALYEYGKSSIPVSENYLRMILPLTTDLDKVSEELFALTTNGGQEYCGAVIKAATESLAWSGSSKDLKAIFIAGNEPFTQGRVDYREACKAAIAKGITVNTIHCGPEQQGIAGKWDDGARLADGKYLTIDQNRVAEYVAAPQDKEITRLGQELNKTYVPFGAMGRVAAERQVRQDVNAQAASPGSLVQRSAAKASLQYKNANWDLVDAAKEGKIKLEDIKAADLPENLRRMNIEQRKAYVVGMTKQRATIQAQIKELTAQRSAYVASELKKRGESGNSTLDAAIVTTVREQAARKNFKLK